MKKKKLVSLLIGLLLGAGSIVQAMAQTPDGQTPAEETVCDPLKADGVTAGLYGLCVAFCEAQDHAAISHPITEAELEVLAAAAPSGRLLANYNKKKSETDPPMPCVVVEEPCPCWEANKLSNTRPPSMNEDFNFANACGNEAIFGDGFALIENFQSGSFNDGFQVGTFGNDCFVFNSNENPDLPSPVLLEVTEEEASACRGSIIAHAQLWADPGRVWDCWPE